MPAPVMTRAPFSFAAATLPERIAEIRRRSKLASYPPVARLVYATDAALVRKFRLDRTEWNDPMSTD